MRWPRIPRILSVRHRGGFFLWIKFDDGVEGEFDLRDVIPSFVNLAKPLADPRFVAKVQVHPELNTITWPGAIDLDPTVLHCVVTGTAIPGESGPRRAPDSAPRRRRPAKRASRRAGSKKR